jgi:hypothetical protein
LEPELKGDALVAPELSAEIWGALIVELSPLLSDSTASLRKPRICSAWPSAVGSLPYVEKLPAGWFVAEKPVLGDGWGGVGWFVPAEVVADRAEPAVAPAEVPPAELPVEAALPATPAAAPSRAAAPTVRAVTAVPIIAAAVLPTSPLTILFAINGMIAIARE